MNPDPAAPIEVEFGAESTKTATASTHPSGAVGRPEHGQVHYHYSNGVVVHSASYPGEPVGGDGGAVFVGTEGRIAVDRAHIVSYPASILKEPFRTGDKRVANITSHSGNFLDCIRTRRPTICNPETAAYTINAILIGGIAMALRRAVKWDPVNGDFPGDEQANRLRSYTPRPPWRF